MADESNKSGGGVGLCTLLAVLFIGLKLTHHIDWSWWWVLSPIWIPVSIVVSVLVILGTVALFAYIHDKREANKRRRTRWETR